MPPYYHGGHGRDNETKHLPSLCYIYVTFMLKWQKNSSKKTKIYIASEPFASFIAC